MIRNTLGGENPNPQGGDQGEAQCDMPETESLTTYAYFAGERRHVRFPGLLPKNGRQNSIPIAGLTYLYVFKLYVFRLGGFVRIYRITHSSTRSKCSCAPRHRARPADGLYQRYSRKFPNALSLFGGCF